MTWICYALGPIDFGWENMTSVTDTIANLRRLGMKGYEDYHDQARKLGQDFENAQRLAKAKGWEGDFSAGPMVFWLPDNDTMAMWAAFVWKQPNNGSTFVVSPFPLPWLK